MQNKYLYENISKYLLYFMLLNIKHQFYKKDFEVLLTIFVLCVDSIWNLMLHRKVFVL